MSFLCLLSHVITYTQIIVTFRLDNDCVFIRYYWNHRIVELERVCKTTESDPLLNAGIQVQVVQYI